MHLIGGADGFGNSVPTTRAYDPALRAWVDLLGPEPLAVDTEADSFHHYREKICLVQLRAGGRHALVDPLAGVDLGLLVKALQG